MSYLERLIEHLREEDNFEKELGRRGRTKGARFDIRVIEPGGDPRGSEMSIGGDELRRKFKELIEGGDSGREIIITELDFEGRVVETLPRVKRV